jgi:hypothetical protein
MKEKSIKTDGYKSIEETSTLSSGNIKKSILTVLM